MHVNLGGCHIRDIEFSGAFDGVKSDAELDLWQAIAAEPDNPIQFCEVPNLGVSGSHGITDDGIGRYLALYVE